MKKADMVEQVARALHARAEARREARSVLADYIPEAWEELYPVRRTDFLLDGFAAIVEMHEPTEAMEEAADEPFHATLKIERERSIRLYGREAFSSVPFSSVIWRAMIDAVLANLR